MTDPKVDHAGNPLPPEVVRHLDRQRKHQAQPIPTDRPTLEQLTSGPPFKRARLLRAASIAGDVERENRLRQMSDAEIEKES